MPKKLDPDTLRWVARRATAMAKQRSWAQGIEGGGRIYLRALAAELRANADELQRPRLTHAMLKRAMLKFSELDKLREEARRSTRLTASDYAVRINARDGE